MKEEKGITLLSLITYIIVLLLVISVVTLVSNFLMNNMNELQSDSKDISEINKFDLSFLTDIKQERVSVYRIGENGEFIILEYPDGRDVQYIYDENAIYRIENNQEKRKISSNIETFKINAEGNKISLVLKIGQEERKKEYKIGK